MRQTFSNHAELWVQLEEHRKLGHDIQVYLHVCGSDLYVEYIVYVPHSRLV